MRWEGGGGQEGVENTHELGGRQGGGGREGGRGRRGQGICARYLWVRPLVVHLEILISERMHTYSGPP